MRYLKHIFLLLGLSWIFLMFGNGVFNLTDPDEVFYVQTAREMASRQEWMTPYLFDGPNFEKPVLVYWLLRIGFLIFGDTSFGARFFPALFAAAGVLAVYALVTIGFGDRKKAFLSAFILMTAGLYVGMARTVFTDMYFTVLIAAAITSFFAATKGWKPGVLFFYMSAGFAVLAKGPLGLLIAMMTGGAFFLLRRDRLVFRWQEHLPGALLFLLITVPWYGAMVSRYGTAFLREFFYNDHWRRLMEAEHHSNDKWYFYPLSALAGMFPWTIFTAAALWCSWTRVRQDVSGVRLLAVLWILAVLAVFQPAHSKLVSYILPLFPPLAILTGDLLMDWWRSRQQRKILLMSSTFTGFIFFLIPGGLLLACSRIQDYFPSRQVLMVVAALLSSFAAGYLFLVFRERRSLLVAPAGILLVVFAVVPLLRPVIEPRVSVASAARWLAVHCHVEGKVLVSKTQVRGVRYYTGNNVAVFRFGNGQFFSPHPIPFINDRAKLSAFLATQPVTYAILEDKDFEELQEQVPAFVSVRELHRNAKLVVLQITRN